MRLPSLEKSLETKSDWNSIYKPAGVFGIFVLLGVISDIIIGSASSASLNELPLTAADRFSEFRDNPLAGFYHLDLLNMIIQLFFIPVYIALFAAHRKCCPALASLGFVLFLTGTIIMVNNNAAMQMYDLSGKYYTANSETQKSLYIAAGEAVLLKGVHGSPGAFLGFLIPGIAGFIISLVMLKGKVFGKMASYSGITGNLLIILYTVGVTFIPAVKDSAVLFAAPGGLLLLAWIFLITKTLFVIGKNNSQ